MSRNGLSHRQWRRRWIFSTAVGMTLMEILMTMTILSLVSGALIRFYITQQRAYERQYALQERDQRLRLAANTLLREVAVAGYHAAGDALVNHLTRWVRSAYFPADMGVRLDANPKITLSPDDKPDLITFLVALPSRTNPTRLARPATGTHIETDLSVSQLARQYRIGDLIFLGDQAAYARVTDVSGKRLTIDTDPLQNGNQPLSRPLPGGSPVGELSVVTYTVFNRKNDPACRRHRAGHPELKRKVNAGGFEPVAEDISDLQIILEPDGRIRLTLTARADASASGTSAREIDFVRPVNLPRAGIGSGCPLPAAPASARVLAGLDRAHPCRILLAWDPVTTDAGGDPLGANACALKGYRVFFDTAPGVFGRHVDVALGAESGYALDVHTLASDVYYVSVAARNMGGVGAKTAEIAVRDTLPPSPPTGLCAVWQPANGVFLTWAAPADCDLAGFQVFRRGPAGSYLRISGGLVPAGRLSFTDVSPPAGEMTYAIRALDGGLNASPYSNGATVTVPVTQRGLP